MNGSKRPNPIKLRMLRLEHCAEASGLSIDYWRDIASKGLIEARALPNTKGSRRKIWLISEDAFYEFLGQKKPERE